MSSSTTTHATDHTSLFGSEPPLISITSGAIQYGVPTTSPSSSDFFGLFEPSRLAPRPSSPILAALPKSASFTHPSLVARRLAPLTSRWTMPFRGECRYARASSTCATYTLQSASGAGPNLLAFIDAASEPASQYSSTM